MWINTGACGSNCITLWMCYALLFYIEWVFTSAAPGVRQLQNDPEQLSLSSSAFSASSVYKNQNEFEAHKANSAVFSSHEESFGAWCPAEPVQNRITEWLQVDFGSMKIMRVLFTEGHPNKQDAYTPSFILRYQRQEGTKWYEYRMQNGSKLLHANRNGQTIAIELDPPIVAKRFRLYPYNDLEPRFMCLRLAIYGSEFKDGVVEYVIPEGNIYQGSAAFNDTIYDGYWTREDSFALKLATSDTKLKRAYLYGGIGVLMDKQYYEGGLPETEGNHNVVGWYRRQYSTLSDRMSMLFVFDQVRNFTQVQFHALRVSDHQGLFRQVLIQFSNEGEHFDRQSKPILSSTVRSLTMDARSQAQWISVNLRHHVGRFVRLTLWFDSDWIILSEITFDSTPMINSSVAVSLKSSSDLLHQLENAELPDIDLNVPYKDTAEATVMRPVAEPFNAAPTTISPHVPTTVNAQKLGSGQIYSKEQGPTIKSSGNKFTDSTSKYQHSTSPYIVAISCCFLGSIAFVSLIAFMLCRLRQSRLKRMKKRQKSLQHVDTNNGPSHNHHYQHPPLLPSTQHPQQSAQNYMFTSDTPTSISVNNYNTSHAVNLLSDSTLSSLLPNNMQYNQLPGIHPAPAFASAYPNLTMTPLMMAQQQQQQNQLNSLPLIGKFPDALNPSTYSQYAPGMDQDSLFRLLQHGSSIPTNISLTGLTLARPETLDTLNLSHQFALGDNIFPPTGAGQCPTQFRFYNPPPPPPDQPLPPLPPPSSSPNSTTMTPGAASQFTEHFHGGRIGNIGANSTLSPYTATATTYPFVPDTAGFLLPLDGSMPEYASASLFSGLGINHPGLTGSTNSSATELDPPNNNYNTKQRFIPADCAAYCAPHLNTIHPHWLHLNSTMNPGGIDLTTNQSDATLQQQQQQPSNELSSVDSNGMYYLINRADKLPLLNFNHISQSVGDPNLPSHTILLPFTSSPFQGLPLIQNYQLVNSQQADSGIGNCNTLAHNDNDIISTVNEISDFEPPPPLPTKLDLTTSRLPLPQNVHGPTAAIQ